ncbi:MAG: Two-component system sensor histidine kinase [uncultured Gemmatimonadetes bacterium]|uniref:histidine kinase n=1 Tax=uncultured Gemmatimonadota bacterium TaxID=203437 RepID=A0A6J4MSM5_9BACT|nr:MAG: Two-component system sensor histidine kinase [uncultured Gemmatimonadota bacterium]
MYESAVAPQSETLRVQQELAHQLELTRNITENVAEGLCLMDSGGRLTYINPAAEQLLGWTQEELLGRKLHEAVHYLHPDGSPFPMETCPLGLTLRDGTHIRDRDDVWIRKGGEFVDVSVTCTPIVKDGAIVGSVLSLHETTEQKRAAEALRQAKDEAERANQAKSEFLAAMSHELRTPLNAIAGYLDLLHLGIHGPVTDAQSQALVRIKRNQEHLLTLINDILNFARVEAGHIEFAIAPIAVDELLAGLGPMVEGQAQARGLAYTFERCDPSLRASGDPSRVRQILLNLVGNATKFTEPGGWIVVWCEASDEAVRIFVRDNGAGIPPARQAAIFDPFVQGERRLDRPAEGVGLGLAISRDLARGMSGELSVQSAPGEGSTFCLRLPYAAQP